MCIDRDNLAQQLEGETAVGLESEFDASPFVLFTSNSHQHSYRNDFTIFDSAAVGGNNEIENKLTALDAASTLLEFAFMQDKETQIQ